MHAPEQVEGEAADASVEDVLDENVHDVLGADGARAELRGRRGKSRSQLTVYGETVATLLFLEKAAMKLSTRLKKGRNAYHGEASLHEEDEVGGEKHERRVHRGSDRVGHIFVEEVAPRANIVGAEESSCRRRKGNKVLAPIP